MDVAMEKFKVGDKVQLKGCNWITMVIENIDENRIFCVWLNHEHRVIREMFFNWTLINLD